MRYPIWAVDLRRWLMFIKTWRVVRARSVIYLFFYFFVWFDWLIDGLIEKTVGDILNIFILICAHNSSENDGNFRWIDWNLFDLFLEQIIFLWISWDILRILSRAKCDSTLPPCGKTAPLYFIFISYSIRTQIDKAQQYISPEQIEDNRQIVDFCRKCLQYRTQLTSSADNEVRRYWIPLDSSIQGAHLYSSFRNLSFGLG